MAEFQTPTKSIYQKKGKGIWRRFIHYVENICVRNVRLEAVGNKVKLAQG